MLASLKHFVELLKESLAYLELDEGYAPEEITEVEIETISKGHCIVSFPEIGVQYFASNWCNWSGKDADWLFSR